MKDRIALLAAALWWGSLTTIGFLVVPMLFVRLGNPAVAGNFAGQLFAAQTWVSLGCGLLLLVHWRSRRGEVESEAVPAAPGGDGTALFLILAALLLALLQQYAVAPHIIAREYLRLWHTAGSAMYGLQWFCAGVLLWRMK